MNSLSIEELRALVERLNVQEAAAVRSGLKRSRGLAVGSVIVPVLGVVGALAMFSAVIAILDLLRLKGHWAVIGSIVGVSILMAVNFVWCLSKGALMEHRGLELRSALKLLSESGRCAAMAYVLRQAEQAPLEVLFARGRQLYVADYLLAQALLERHDDALEAADEQRVALERLAREKQACAALHARVAP